jgi:hypothetical protein
VWIRIQLFEIDSELDKILLPKVQMDFQIILKSSRAAKQDIKKKTVHGFMCTVFQNYVVGTLNFLYKNQNIQTSVSNKRQIVRYFFYLYFKSSKFTKNSENCFNEYRR